MKLDQVATGARVVFVACGPYHAAMRGLRMDVRFQPTGAGRLMDGRHRYGRDYEDFVVGDVYRHWPGRTITEFDDTLFAHLTLNQHPLHSDAAYAASTQHGQRLVVGTLVFSLVVGMSVADVSGRAIANLEYESVRHVGPTFHGDTLYAESRVVEKRATSDGQRGVVTVDTRGYNQRDETVLTLRRRLLVARRPSQPADMPAREDD